MDELMRRLDPASYRRLLEASWLSLSRNAEERAVYIALPVMDRLLFALRELARRFPRRHASGTLIDLQLLNPFLARLIGANRSTVSRCLGRLADMGLLIRLKDLIVMPLPATA
jgi:CRP-like cAMP-binding protein